MNKKQHIKQPQGCLNITNRYDLFRIALVVIKCIPHAAKFSAWASIERRVDFRKYSIFGNPRVMLKTWRRGV